MKKIGLAGLPNAGKSSIFRELTKKETLVANYCFSTTSANIESFKIEDKRICKIKSFFKNPLLKNAELKICDIPGIVKDASKNTGMGSKFISYIRECDLIIIVIRTFFDENIVHFEGEINPLRDFETVNGELILSDLERVEKKISKNLEISKKKEFLENIEEENIFFEKLKNQLTNNKHISDIKWESEKEKELLKSYNFITNKPFFILLNSGRKNLGIEKLKKENEKFFDIVEIDVKKGIRISTKLENDNSEIFFKTVLKMLKLKTFFTAGEKEVRSWIIDKNSNAKECASLIHSDISNRLIRVSFSNIAECKNINDFKKNKKREKKDYIVKDGDICDFIFN